VRLARERTGAPVDQGLAEERLSEERDQDVICMWHVLEHVASPVALLRAATKALKPGGSLFLEVPNISGAGARALGAGWPQLAFSDHAVYFSPQALIATLRRAGLREVEVGTVLLWEYLSPRDRLKPRHVAGRLHRNVHGRTLRTHHPTNGDLLRAVARPATP
jgi:2-polyprenyl-3-methyl-5-hydroxy-6-metoxy-1,4-benzoquinol methylase